MFMEEHIYVESSVCTHGNSKIEPVATVAAVAAVVAGGVHASYALLCG